MSSFPCLFFFIFLFIFLCPSLSFSLSFFLSVSLSLLYSLSLSLSRSLALSDSIRSCTCSWSIHKESCLFVFENILWILAMLFVSSGLSVKMFKQTYLGDRVKTSPNGLCLPLKYCQKENKWLDQYQSILPNTVAWTSTSHVWLPGSPTTSQHRRNHLVLKSCIGEAFDLNSKKVWVRKTMPKKKHTHPKV